MRTSTVARAAVPKIDLQKLLTRQQLVLTRRQALAAGLDDEVIRRELRAGHWQRLLPGVYGAFSGTATLEQKRVAAILYAGRHAQLAGLSALALHGLRHLPTDPQVHVLVPHATRRVSRDFVCVHRTKRMDQSAGMANGYALCSVARAVADACRELDDLRAVQAIVAEAVQREMTTPGALARELDLAGTSRTRLLRRALRDIRFGPRSVAEIDFKNVLGRSTVLRHIAWNAALVTADGTSLPTPDGWLPDAGIALEVDSREYHLSPEQWQRTMRRHNILAAHGVLVLHFTPSEIRNRPANVRRTVESAYRARLRDGARVSVRQSSPVE
jgi:hypothetical protein